MPERPRRGSAASSRRCRDSSIAKAAPSLLRERVGYIPFDPSAANLMFMLVSRRHERASLIVTSNKPFSAWGEIFGDDVVAAPMIDRLVHHAEILALKATPTASKTATSPDTLSASDARGERRSGLARRAASTPPATAPQVAHSSTGATGPHFDRP